jgi:hypothetical protein
MVAPEARREAHKCEGETTMEELTHKIQYCLTKSNSDVGWHTMAAFNNEAAAKNYCNECRKGGAIGIEYRVAPITLNDMTWGSHMTAS